jgi:hypothetical protein
VTTIPQGLKVALLIWLGITALQVGTLYMFLGHSFSLWALDIGRLLANYALAGIVLPAWAKES